MVHQFAPGWQTSSRVNCGQDPSCAPSRSRVQGLDPEAPLDGPHPPSARANRFRDDHGGSGCTPGGISPVTNPRSDLPGMERRRTGSRFCVTSRLSTSRRASRVSLAGSRSGKEEGALAVVAGQGRGALELGAGFGLAAQPAEEVRADAGEQMIALE